MSYKIVIEQASFAKQVKAINPKLIIADQNVVIDHLIDQTINCEYVVVSEQNKSFEFYFELLNLFEMYKLNRNDIVMFVGGGVLIDVASFAASTYKRGINYINVPTTTLSMIDSSVGSKNGLNYKNQKNLVGTFNDPQTVIIDIDFLQTLDARNYNNGLAEAIKIGYLSNAEIISALDCPNPNIEHVIKLSIEEKLRYVEVDKHDHGYRNNLNFGHTFGHGIESLDQFKSIMHGEAVAIGMVIASGYDQSLIALLSKYNLPTSLPPHININQLVKMMKGDKKNTSQLITVILKNPQLQTVQLTEQQVMELIAPCIEIPNAHLTGTVTVNKSKSHIHRLLAGCLATRQTTNFEFDVENDLSDDVLQTINVLKACQADVTFADGKMFVDATSISKPVTPIFIYKSATTYRMFAPLLCSLFGAVEIELDEQLQMRPHQVFTNFVNGTNHNISFTEEHYQIDGSVSSQFISGYIWALVAQNKMGQIEITGKITSRPYIEMTIAVATAFGAQIEFAQNTIVIQSVNKAKQLQLNAEPDYSSLGYFTVYNHLCELNGIDSRLKCQDQYHESLQADSVLPKLLTSSVIDMTDCPDLLPTLVVLGLLNKKGLTLTNTSRIKFKECDRIEAMITNLQDLNAIERFENEVVIKPVKTINGRIVDVYGDHRIAMAFTILSPFCQGPIILSDRTVVDKSFPTFFKQLLKEQNERII